MTASTLAAMWALWVPHHSPEKILAAIDRAVAKMRLPCRLEGFLHLVTAKMRADGMGDGLIDALKSPTAEMLLEIAEEATGSRKE